MDYSKYEAMDESEAFAVCSTSELVALGLVSDSDLDELFAPWGEEVEVTQAA